MEERRGSFAQVCLTASNGALELSSRSSQLKQRNRKEERVQRLCLKRFGWAEEKERRWLIRSAPCSAPSIHWRTLQMIEK